MIPAALVENGTIMPFLYEQAFTAKGVNHPANVLTLWTPAQLKKIGVYPLVRAAAPAPYHTPGEPTYSFSQIKRKVIESRTDKIMPLSDIKPLKQNEIDMEFEAAVQSMTLGYPQAERESWITQEDEANTYIKGRPSPFLDGLALARGVPIADIIARIKINAAAFKTASAAFIGRRQARTDALNAATTVTEAINV